VVSAPRSVGTVLFTLVLFVVNASSSSTGREVAPDPAGRTDLVAAGRTDDRSQSTTDPADPPKGVLSRGTGRALTGASAVVGGLVVLGGTLTLLVRRRHASSANSDPHT